MQNKTGDKQVPACIYACMNITNKGLINNYAEERSKSHRSKFSENAAVSYCSDIGVKDADAAPMLTTK
jgi:hypothetical protein